MWILQEHEKINTKRIDFRLLLPVYWSVKKITYDDGGHAPGGIHVYFVILVHNA